MKGEISKFRNTSKVVIEYFGDTGDSSNGVFNIPNERGGMRVLASSYGGWEHVSVTMEDISSCPTWEEMCRVKELFFKDTEIVLQLHPPKDDNINIHPHCLHLWRHITRKFKMPPKEFV